jgi:D-amino peptidase
MLAGMRRWICVLALACSAAAQPRRSILLITDAEGVAGICRQEQTDPKDPELRALLTAEVNAAVEGFLEGGLDDVYVWDGHDGSATLSALTIHPRARLIIGGLGRSMTLERRYSAIGFLGQHAMAGVRAGIMAHSYSSLGIQNIRINGRRVGEIETRAALAGAFDTPVVFLSGDQAAVEELKAIVPQAETVAVMEGLARHVCISMSAEMSRQAIRAAARRAAAKIGQVPPYVISGPVVLEVEYTTRNSLRLDAAHALGGEVVDDRTIRYRGADFLDAWTRARLW